jgi:hypothetical protein
LSSSAPIPQALPALATAVPPTPEVAIYVGPDDAEMTAAAQRARFLITRYSVPDADVANLTKDTYQLATMLKLSKEGRTTLHQLALDYAENGGPGLRQFGIEGDDLTVARELGGTSERQLLAMTPSQVVRARTLIATKGILNYVIHGN